jgi:glycine/D-amino acid oxidase-like deaminating enzyme
LSLGQRVDTATQASSSMIACMRASVKRENLYIACGGSGHAFKFAPLLGGWIADAIEGRHNLVLERFSWREPVGRETEEALYAGS